MYSSRKTFYIRLQKDTIIAKMHVHVHEGLNRYLYRNTHVAIRE